MMNFKQEEVLHNIMRRLQKKFAEARLVGVSELGANSFWITVTEPSDEEQQLELDHLMADLSTDALMDYGFDFQFVPTSVAQAAA